MLLGKYCKEKTTFFLYGTFWFEIVPFGLMNALMTFQRAMETLLKGFEFVRVYLDDIALFFKALDGHFDHLASV